MASRSPCATTQRAVWRTSACTARTKATTSRRRLRACSRGPALVASPTGSGSDTSGTTLEIVPLEKCRYDLGLEVPDTTAADGEVNITEFPSCLMAEIPIAGTVDVELRALDWLYLGWLPTSGYAPAHQPMFEAFNGRPFAHGGEHFELRVQLAVVDESVPL